MFYGHGAVLHATAAGCTGPDSVLCDSAADKRRTLGGFVPFILTAGQKEFRPHLQQMRFEVDNKFFGVQGLAGTGRGAVVAATTAFNTGIQIQVLFPGEFLDFRNAERFRPFLFHIQFPHLPHRAGTPENKIQRTCHQVQVFGGNNQQDNEHEVHESIAPPCDMGDYQQGKRFHIR